MESPKEKRKTLIAIILVGMVCAMYCFQAYGEVTAKFHYPVPLEFLGFVGIVIGAGVFELSLSYLVAFRQLLGGKQPIEKILDDEPIEQPDTVADVVVVPIDEVITDGGT